MKKFLTVTLALLLSLSLCACGLGGGGIPAVIGRLLQNEEQDAGQINGQEEHETGSETESQDDNRYLPEPSGTTDVPEDDPDEDPEENPEDAEPTGERGTKLYMAPGGQLEVVRISGKAPAYAPRDGIWTIFVYMCGSDLESLYGMATNDLREMEAATRETADLRFVVEAGGADYWEKPECRDGENVRLIISGGEIQRVETPAANMGEADTLYEFLDWGLENYHSQYMMLDFWDHGGASILGVCFDERYEYDSLSLLEMDTALARLYRRHAVKFDAIGFDACLMGTVEAANIFVPYGKYMIASQEIEPQTGWDYAGFGQGVKAGVSDGGQLGKYICDAYYASVPEKSQKIATLSVIDLSRLDEFLPQFNDYCKNIYEYVCEGNGLDSVMETARKLPSFGADKCYNSTDLGLLLQKTSDYSDAAKQALSLMEKCVVYKVNGESHKDVGGIAIYFPLDAAKGEQHMNSLKELCVTPYYLGIADICAYGRAFTGDVSGCDMERWIEEDSEYWSGRAVSESDYSYWEDGLHGALNFDREYAGRLFSVLPHRKEADMAGYWEQQLQGVLTFGEDYQAVWDYLMELMEEYAENPNKGYDSYSFTLSDEGLKKVENVYTNTFEVITLEDTELLMDLGVEFVRSGEYYRSAGVRTEEQVFFGMQAGLPGGHIVSPHPLTRRYVEGYGYVNYYYTPVFYNDDGTKQTANIKNLVFYEYYENKADESLSLGMNLILNTPTIIAVGTVDVGKDVVVSRIEPLRKGDSIQPVFPAYSEDTMEFKSYIYLTSEEPYICEEDGVFRLAWNASVPNNATYKWSYLITDIYGNHLYTDAVTVQVERSIDSMQQNTMTD